MKSHNKRLKHWNKVRDEELKPLFAEKGITSCELRLSGCTGSLFAGFAHRKPRVDYYNDLEGLKSFSEILLSCSSCHAKIDLNKAFKEMMFKKLRG